MFREILEKLAFEVIYLETERKECEKNEEEMYVTIFNARAQEARHIMVKLFGIETATIAIIDARNKCKGKNAFEIWKEYITEE